MEEQPTVAEITEDIGAMIMGEDPVDASSGADDADIAPQTEPEAADEPIEAQEDTEAGVDDDPALEADTEETPEFVEVEYEGQLYEVPTHLKDALLRQDDYTKKTQGVSAQKKEVEVLQGELQSRTALLNFSESVRGDVLQAQQLEATANQYHEYMRENIDSLTSTDIEKIRFGIEDTRRQRDELIQSVKGKETEFQQAQEQFHEELLNKGTEVLRQKIPGWGDEKQKQVRDYAMSSGFTEAELNQVVDPRQVEALYKAAQYDALKSGVTPAVKKVQEAPSIKPKSRNPMPKETQAKLNLRKKMNSNSLSDKQKAEALASDFGERWG